MIDLGHAPIRGVHRGENDQVCRELKAPLRVRQRDGLLTILQQVEQFAEDARQVAAIEFIDQQDERFGRPTRCLGGEGTEHAVFHRVGDVMPAVRFDGLDPDALDELFVTVGGMKLHKPERVLSTADQEPGETAGDVRLARSGYALKDQLFLEG